MWKVPLRSGAVARHMTPLWGKGNLLKGNDNKIVRRYGFSNTTAQNYFLNGNHIWPTLFEKTGFLFEIKKN